MPRRLRIEFDGAIYHVMARGNARQNIVHDDQDRHRLLDDLARTVTRSGWELLAFVVMTNHLHLLLKTPRPNLAKGMQAFLSSYALYAGRRRRRGGHLFQGRYKAEMIEDDSYYWTVSRYIHLNLIRVGLAHRPEHREWSSYPGYADPSRTRPWIAHEALLRAWRGEHGGTEPAHAYRRIVEAGLIEPEKGSGAPFPARFRSRKLTSMSR